MSIRPSRTIPVICVETGKKYDSITDAAIDIGQKKPSNIIVALKSGGRAGGYHWRFDDMPPSIRDNILSHFFMSDVEIAEIEAEKEQNETSIERSREELEMEAKATLAKFNNRAPKRTFGTEKTNRG